MVDAYNALYLAEPSQSAPGGYALRGDGPAARLGSGRVLGLQYAASGDIVACDSVKGLLEISRDFHQVCLLARSVSADSPLDPGTPVGFANTLDIARDGTIYFSESTVIQPPLDQATKKYDVMEAYYLSIIKGEASGRLLRYNPADRSTHVLMTGLWFANGVALSADEDFVLVAETNMMRIHRIWLKGEKAGTADLLVRDLPGYLDNIARAPDGNFWVAVVGPAMPEATQQAFRSPLVRLLLAWFKGARPQPGHWAGVVKVSPQGEVLDCLLDEDGSHVKSITSVVEAADGKLWLGILMGNSVSYFDLHSHARTN